MRRVRHFLDAGELSLGTIAVGIDVIGTVKKNIYADKCSKNDIGPNLNFENIFLSNKIR